MGIYKRKRGGKLTKNYYGKYRDDYGNWREVAFRSDKESSIELLGKLSREARDIREGVATAYHQHANTPLEKHLDEFATDLAS